MTFNPFDPSLISPFPGMAALTNRPARQPIDFMSFVSPILAQLNATQTAEERQKQQEIENAQKQQQLGIQQGTLTETSRYHDIENQRYQDQNARLTKAELDKNIAAITDRLREARTPDERQALMQQLGQLTGWQMGEFATNYQAPPAAPAAAEPSSPAGAPPLSFDDAYSAMTQKESGGNPRAVNPQSGALGTFQLMQDQLPAMGLTKDQFLAMTPEQQKQVYLTKYLPAHGLDASTLAPKDVGLSVGAPAAITMPDDAVVYPKGSKAVAQNPTWDRNKDGQITAAELRQNYGGAPPGPPASIARPPEPAPPTGPAPFLQDFMNQQPPAQDQAPSGAMPWELLGLGSPPPPKPEEPVAGGGRYVFKDATGKTMYEYDSAKVQADQKDSVRQGLQSLLDNATTDEEKKAARAAIGFATGAVGNGLNPKEAYTQGLTYYEKALSEQGKTARAGVSSGWGQLKEFGNKAESVHKDVMQQFGIPKLEQSELDLRQGLAAITANNGLGDTAALGKFMKDLEAGRISDEDVKRYANSAGWINEFLNFGNRILNGEKNPELMSQLKGLLETNLSLIQKRRQEAADNAYMSIYSLRDMFPMVPEDITRQAAQRAQQRVLGGAGSGAPAGANTNPGGVGGALNQVGSQLTGAANAYGQKTLDELEKELGQ